MYMWLMTSNPDSAVLYWLEQRTFALNFMEWSGYVFKYVTDCIFNSMPSNSCPISTPESYQTGMHQLIWCQYWSTHTKMMLVKLFNVDIVLVYHFNRYPSEVVLYSQFKILKFCNSLPWHNLSYVDFMHLTEYYVMNFDFWYRKKGWKNCILLLLLHLYLLE